MRRRCGNCRVLTDPGSRLPRIPDCSGFPMDCRSPPGAVDPDSRLPRFSDCPLARSTRHRQPARLGSRNRTSRAQSWSGVCGPPSAGEAECRQRPSGSRRRPRGAAPSVRRTRADRRTVACTRADRVGIRRSATVPGTCAPHAGPRRVDMTCDPFVRQREPDQQFRRRSPGAGGSAAGAAGSVLVRRGGAGVAGVRWQVPMRAPVGVAWPSTMRAAVARLDRAPCASLSAAGGVAPRGQTGRDSSVGRARD
jgi:hypothetical protein